MLHVHPYRGMRVENEDRPAHKVKRWGSESELESRLNAQLRELTEDVRMLRREIWEMTGHGRPAAGALADEQLRLRMHGTEESPS